MRIILVLFALSTFSTWNFAQNYKTEHQETISYSEGNNSGNIKFKVVFDAFFGEPIIKVIAEVADYQSCKPGIIDISIDIYSGNAKVSSKTFTNVISFDVAGSPDWDELFPGLSADEAKKLYKSGFSIRNVRAVNLGFAGCSDDTNDSGSNSSNSSSNSSSSNSSGVSTSSSSTSSSTEKTAQQQHEEHVGANNARVEEQRRLENAQRQAAAQKKAQEDAARKKAEEEAARREQERRAENQRKKQEYDKRVQEQNTRNTEAAGAMAASSMGAMVAIGLAVYADMGKVNPSDTYFGNQFYGGIDMGYSLSSIPLVFNSSRTTYIYNYNTGDNEYITTNNDDDRRASTINLEFKPFLGYEHEYGGAEVYGCFQPGMSIIFDRFNLSHYIGGKVYGGIANVKFFYEHQRGARRFNAMDWIDSEEYGSGVIRYKNKKNIIGARFSFESSGYAYARHHIHIGYIMENFIESLDHEAGNTRLWYYDLDPTLQSDPDKYYRIKGWHLSWNKEHNFNFYANIYPNHPFAGINKYSDSDSFDDRTEGAVFFEIGFVRQIKNFF